MSATGVGEGVTAFVAVAAEAEGHYVVHVAPLDRPGEPVCPATATVREVEGLDGIGPLGYCGACLVAMQTAFHDGVVKGEHRAAVLLRDYLAQMHRMCTEGEGGGETRASAFDRRRVRVVVEFDVSLDQVDATSVHPRGWDIATEIDMRVARTLTGMPGVVGEARTTDFRMTDPPRGSTR